MALSSRTSLAAALTALLAGVVLSGCSTNSTTTTGSSSGVLNVVAAENFWGSLASQVGGTHVKVTNIINSPDADPHSYEPTAADARAVSTADLVLVNGIGYDSWAGKLVDANPRSSRTLLDVGKVLGIPDNGNPHRWYSPADVRTVIATITKDLSALAPADAKTFQAQEQTLLATTLKPYFDTIAAIKTRYAGTPVGASESIFAPLADGLGLKLLTPPSFLTAISEGTDPTSRDKLTIDAQIAQHQIKLFVYNSQNATPDIQQQVKAAQAAGIPVDTVTETLTPAGASFQQWQVGQLGRLKDALARGTGR
ncbi:MAG: putative cation transporter, periplasmic cation-binding protein [Frankiales bacterium]|nr:putative cation transporter, periplasmic cation-binding protein [Frankiales bacterium]